MKGPTEEWRDAEVSSRLSTGRKSTGHFPMLHVSIPLSLGFHPGLLSDRARSRKRRTCAVVHREFIDIRRDPMYKASQRSKLATATRVSDVVTINN